MSSFARFGKSSVCNKFSSGFLAFLFVRDLFFCQENFSKFLQVRLKTVQAKRPKRAQTHTAREGEQRLIGLFEVTTDEGRLIKAAVPLKKKNLVGVERGPRGTSCFLCEDDRN